MYPEHSSGYHHAELRTKAHITHQILLFKFPYPLKYHRKILNTDLACTYSQERCIHKLPGLFKHCPPTIQDPAQPTIIFVIFYEVKALCFLLPLLVLAEAAGHLSLLKVSTWVMREQYRRAYVLYVRLQDAMLKHLALVIIETNSPSCHI